MTLLTLQVAATYKGLLQQVSLALMAVQQEAQAQQAQGLAQPLACSANSSLPSASAFVSASTTGASASSGLGAQPAGLPATTALGSPPGSAVANSPPGPCSSSGSGGSAECPTPAAQQVLSAVLELSTLVERVSMYTPAHIKRLLAANLDTLAPAEGGAGGPALAAAAYAASRPRAFRCTPVRLGARSSPPADARAGSPPCCRSAGIPKQHWRDVEQQLGVTQQQREDIVAAHKRMLQQMVPVLLERQRLAAQLAMAAAPAGINYIELGRTGLQVGGGGGGVGPRRALWDKLHGAHCVVWNAHSYCKASQLVLFGHHKPWAPEAAHVPTSTPCPPAH